MRTNENTRGLKLTLVECNQGSIRYDGKITSSLRDVKLVPIRNKDRLFLKAAVRGETVKSKIETF